MGTKSLRAVVGLLMILTCTGCGGTGGAAAGSNGSPAEARTQTTAVVVAEDEPQPRPAEPPTMVCGVGTSEEAVANEILVRSGRGLLWLLGPVDVGEAVGASGDRRGVQEVRDARALADCLLKHHGPDFDPEQRQGFEHFEQWLRVNVGPEHGASLLAAGAAYFASLLVASSGIDAMLDVSTARLLLERACEADAEQWDGLGPLILGAYECFVPRMAGGEPERGLARLGEAAKSDGSLRLAMKVASAELCAVALQDRFLFERLLREVLETGGGLGPFDVAAKARAQGLLREGPDFFIE